VTRVRCSLCVRSWTADNRELAETLFACNWTSCVKDDYCDKQCVFWPELLHRLTLLLSSMRVSPLSAYCSAGATVYCIHLLQQWSPLRWHECIPRDLYHRPILATAHRLHNLGQHAIQPLHRKLGKRAVKLIAQAVKRLTGACRLAGYCK